MSAKNDTLRRVLLVEDDREKASSFATVLGDAGYDVKMAADGNFALAIAEQFSPDVCLVDVSAAGLDEIELVRFLREQLERPPLVANVTPFAERDDWDSEVQFDLDFTKPSDPAQVVAQLSDFLRTDSREMRRNVHDVAQEGIPRMPSYRK